MTTSITSAEKGKGIGGQGLTTYAQYQAIGLAFLKAQVGKGYSEQPGQNFGPNTYDCQGLAFCCYRAAANLVTGPGIGLIGSRAQFEDSTVKLTPADSWLVLDQCFFDGADPPYGHTGVYVGPVVPGGAPMMIDAYDTAEGVRYNEFDPNVTDTGPGLILRGRTRPLSLIASPVPPKGQDMFLFKAPAPSINGYVFSGGVATLVPDGPDYAALKAAGIPEPELSAAWRAHLATLAR